MSEPQPTAAHVKATVRQPVRNRARARARTAEAGGITLPGPIRYWPLARLKTYARNPRTHSPGQVNRLAASILEYGWTNPILVDGAAGIVAGHGRLLAAQKLGLKQVPVIELGHLTEAQRRAYLLADNKLALDAEWDPGLLLAELNALAEETLDIGAAGFTEDELRELETAAAAASKPPRSPSGARAGRILHMLEFDTLEQKERWLEFMTWLRAKASGKSFAAALTDHVTVTMENGRSRASSPRKG